MLGEWKLPAPPILDLPKPSTDAEPDEATKSPLPLLLIGPDKLRSIDNEGDEAPRGLETGVRKDDDFVMDKIVGGCVMLIAGMTVLMENGCCPVIILLFNDDAPPPPPKNMEEAADDGVLPKPVALEDDSERR